MNKLQGFLELEDANLPSIPWKEFDETTILDTTKLYSIRVATYQGRDLDLPKRIGIDGKEGYFFALDLYKKYKETGEGIVIYYPCYQANKSGNIIISLNEEVIECVVGDLWNLNQKNQTNVTILINDKGNVTYQGNKDFLSKEEKQELLNYSKRIKALYRDELLSGQSILLEWLYGAIIDENQMLDSKQQLVFLELRSIK